MRRKHLITLVEVGIFAAVLPDMSESMNKMFERSFFDNIIQLVLELNADALSFFAKIGAVVHIRGEPNRNWMWRTGKALALA